MIAEILLSAPPALAETVHILRSAGANLPFAISARIRAIIEQTSQSRTGNIESMLFRHSSAGSDSHPVQFALPLTNRLITAWAFIAFLLGSLPMLAAAEDQENSASAHQPTPGQAHVISDLKLELIWVEPGTFMMGSPADEPLRHKAEGPRTRVTLTKGFWLGRTEITQAQYEALIGTNPSTFKEVGPDAPAERVSWFNAVAYCEVLTDRERAAGRLPEGYVYTLPTEAQWEYACRAGTTGAYAGEPDALSWYDRNSNGSTHPVGEKQPNAWGFHDMPGNVLEWCLDWYGDYPGGSVTDPSGPFRGYYRIARGGSWRTDARLGRSASRSGGSEGRLDYTIGFRIALSAER